jgi:hypothetical protein
MKCKAYFISVLEREIYYSNSETYAVKSSYLELTFFFEGIIKMIIHLFLK